LEGRGRGGLKAEQEVARIAPGATSRTAVETWNLSSMPHGWSYHGPPTVAGAMGPGEPLAAQVGKPLSLAHGFAAYPESVSSS
jgi:hypothetical protein